MATTIDRLSALEQQVTANSVLLTEIHAAVIGNGAKGSSLRERVAALETSNDFRHKAVYAVFPSLLVSVLSHLGWPVHGGAS
jgi:hypothetical protein